MTPRFFLRPEAKADAREAFAWYEERSTGLGYEFLRALRAALSPLAREPRQFPVVLDDIRRTRLRRFSLFGLLCGHGGGHHRDRRHARPARPSTLAGASLMPNQRMDQPGRGRQLSRRWHDRSS